MKTSVRAQLWQILGWVMLGLGVIGLALPIMPTVPFLLASAACFSRGSPATYQWLLSHPWYGPPIRRWREQRVITTKTKVQATLLLGLSLGTSIVFFVPLAWVKALLAGIGLSVLGFIWAQRSA